MLFFILKKKWKAYFNLRRNWRELVLQLLWLLFLVVSSLLVAFLYDSSIQHQIPIKPLSIIQGVCFFWLLFPGFLRFFPSLTVKQTVLKNHYPLSRIKKANFDILYSIFSSPFPFFLLLSSLLLTINSSFHLFHFLLFISIGMSGILFADNLVSATNPVRKDYLMLLLFLLVSIIVVMRQEIFIEYALIFGLAMILLLTVIRYLFYHPAWTETVKVDQLLFCRSRNITLKLVIRNKKYRDASLFAIVLQTIFVYFFLSFFNGKLHILVFYVISFVMLFSYCFNNTWGFFMPVLLNKVIAGNTMRDLVFTFIKIIFPALFINFTICLSALIAFYFDFSWMIFLGMMALLLFSIVLGIIFSFLKWRSVTKAISLSGGSYNTDIIATHIYGGVSLILGFCQEKGDSLFFIGVIMIVVLSVAALIVVFKFQKKFIERAKSSIVIKRR